MNTKDFAFHPTGNTFLIASSTTAPTGVQVSSEEDVFSKNADCYQIYNAGTEVSYVGWGNTAGQAQSASVVPTAGNPQKVIPVPAGAVMVCRFGNNTFFSGINPTAAGNLFITPGEGQ